MMYTPFEKRLLHKPNKNTFRIDIKDVLKSDDDYAIKRCHMKHTNTSITLDKWVSYTFQQNDMVVKLDDFYDLEAVGWKDEWKNSNITCGCIPRFNTPTINPFMFIRYKRSMIKDYDEFVKRVHEIFYKINVLSSCRVYFTYQIDKDFNEKEQEYVCIYVIFDSYSFLSLPDCRIFVETFILLHMTELKDFEILDIYDFIDVYNDISKHNKIIKNDSENENDDKNENNDEKAVEDACNHVVKKTVVKKTVVKSSPKRYSCWLKFPLPYKINSVNLCMEYIRRIREDRFDRMNMVDPESKSFINTLEDVKFYTAKLLDIDNPGQFATKIKHDDLIGRSQYGSYKVYQKPSRYDFININKRENNDKLDIFKPLTYSKINTTKNTFSDKVNPTFDITDYII